MQPLSLLFEIMTGQNGPDQHYSFTDPGPDEEVKARYLLRKDKSSPVDKILSCPAGPLRNNTHIR